MLERRCVRLLHRRLSASALLDALGGQDALPGYMGALGQPPETTLRMFLEDRPHLFQSRGGQCSAVEGASDFLRYERSLLSFLATDLKRRAPFTWSLLLSWALETVKLPPPVLQATSDISRFVRFYFPDRVWVDQLRRTFHLRPFDSDYITFLQQCCYEFRKSACGGGCREDNSCPYVMPCPAARTGYRD
ncbi:hypothetical protein ABPG75_009673 [Micractinium tetrahymenae]